MSDPQFMQRALELAARGLGHVEPNPMVGCVVVRGGRIIGEGWHRKFGGPHAEVEALRDCERRGQSAKGADVYVSLEPCCHHGKTPPCSDALIAARVKRVFVATADPFPKVAGGGIRQLRRAKIGVDIGLLEGDARELNRAFFKRVATGLPWVTAKWAQTLDGRVATANGDSKWISNETSRAFVHAMRAGVDAIIIGIGTVLADDPLLTARPAGRSKRPAAVPRVARRVVIDPDLRLPASSQLVRSLPIPLTVAVKTRLLKQPPARLAALEKRGVEFIGLPSLRSSTNRLDLRPLLRHLAEKHVATNVIVEGGPTLLGSFFTQHLIDQALVFVAPKLVGDADAPGCVAGLRCNRIADAIQLRLHESRRFGDDVMFDLRVVTK